MQHPTRFTVTRIAAIVYFFLTGLNFFIGNAVVTVIAAIAAIVVAIALAFDW